MSHVVRAASGAAAGRGGELSKLFSRTASLLTMDAALQAAVHKRNKAIAQNLSRNGSPVWVAPSPANKHFSGSIGGGEGKFDISLSSSGVALMITWQRVCIEMRLKLHARIRASHAGCRLPEGYGDIMLNGETVARYNGAGATMQQSGRRICLLRDGWYRRFRWALMQGASLTRALGYAWNRRYVLCSDAWCLASFCGDVGRARLLNFPDAEVMAAQPPEEQATVVALGYLWAACAPYADGFVLPPGETKLVGSYVPDLPSFDALDDGGWSAVPRALKRGYIVRLLFNLISGGWLLILTGLCLAAGVAYMLDFASSRWLHSWHTRYAVSHRNSSVYPVVALSCFVAACVFLIIYAILRVRQRRKCARFTSASLPG